MNRNIRLVYWILFAKNFILFFSVFVLFLQEHGLSMEEIFLLRAIHVLGIVMLEVPTGYLGDRIGRKKTLLLGAAVALLGAVIYCVAYGFWMFLIAELIMAIQVTLYSGTQDALVHESLSAEGKEGEYWKVMTNCGIIGSSSNAIASLLGAGLATFGLRWTVYAIVPLFGSVFLLTLFLKEPPMQKMSEHLGDGSIRAIARFTCGHEPLKRFLPFNSLLAGLLATAFWSSQEYQVLIHMETWMYGIMESFYKAGVALAGLIALWMGLRFGRRRILASTFLCACLIYVACGMILDARCLILLVILRSLDGVFHPLSSDILNKMPITGARATVNSIASLCAHFSEALFCVIASFAIYVGKTDLSGFTALGISGAVLLTAAYAYMQRGNAAH